MVVQRALGLIWCALCLVVAGGSALQILVTFAPSHGRTGDLAAAELAGMERARVFWWGNVWAAAGVLAVSGVVIAVLTWKRRPA